jgi:hypothetical protein
MSSPLLQWIEGTVVDRVLKSIRRRELLQHTLIDGGTVARQNCWEFKKCGREEGGTNVPELGVCPAAIEERVNTLNNGKNGGRSCWALAFTLCGGTVQGTFATKLSNCLKCEFYQLVAAEEGADHKSSKEILSEFL